MGESELYGKISAVGERTFAAPRRRSSARTPPRSRSRTLYVGWRSGKSVGSSENLLDFTVGRTQYKIGHGFLLWDGGGEGGSRGGYWSNARKAWQFAAIGRVKPRNHTLEAFYLDRDEVPESETGTRVWGANYELAVGEKSTFGATYLKFYADRTLKPNRDGLNVYNARAFTAPFKSLPGLVFELEYAHEQNGDLLKSDAWTAQVAYEMRQGGLEAQALLPLRLSSRATTPRPRRTRPSTRCFPASTTGARGGRARSPGSTSSPTPT